MDQKGVVVRVLSDGIAEVSIMRESACGDSCSSCGGDCSLSEVTVKASNSPENIGVGDIVKIKGSTSKMILSAFLAYIVPLIFLMVGTIGGSELLKSLDVELYEILGFLIGLLALGASFFVIRYMGNRLASEKVNFEIVEIVSKANRS